MLITKNISAYNQLATFAQDKWDKVGNLVKFILDNHKESAFDTYVNEEFPNGADECEFEDFCCIEADDIILRLKGEVISVDFNDCEFGCFEPHMDVIYNGGSYRVIDVDITLGDGTKETHTIAEKSLEFELAKEVGGNVCDINCDLDDSISYYADNNDGVYFILERITGMKIP